MQVGGGGLVLVTVLGCHFSVMGGAQIRVKSFRDDIKAIYD